MSWASLSEAQDKAAKPAGRAPAPVTEAVAALRELPVEIKAVGNVESSAVVQVKSRVGGEIVAVHFEDGQDVREGDPLFTLDPRPLEAAYKEAKAKLERNKALQAKAEEDNRRYKDLLAKGIISREAYDQVRTNADALAAAVRADEASMESARLQLSYARIASPITGRAGAIQAHKGNVIKANDDKAMVVIEKIDPIQASFSVPEARLPAIMERMRQGQPPVTARPQGAARAESGRLTFIDNAVDPKTGTIKLKATFDNKDRRLWPGQFVDVSLTVGALKNVVAAPAQAVQTGLEGPFVFVIKPDMTVELRKVVPGPTIGGETVIESGVAAGERVVVEGHLRLTPGAPIEIKTGEARPAETKSPEAKPAQPGHPPSQKTGG